MLKTVFSILWVNMGPLLPSRTLQQLQAGSASCADMADFVFCVPLGAASSGVTPTWTQTHVNDLKV